jgi:predicted kinase
MLPLYQTHRALVRAKITALEAAGAEEAELRQAALEQHREYLRYAGRQVASRQPRLLLMFGLSGSGKTWFAGKLAPLLDAVHIRSDVERKRLAGLPEQQRTSSELEKGIYSPAFSARLYARLEECADHALAGGYTVIVDAAFHRRDDRSSFSALAARHGAPLQLIRCRASRRELERRIRARAGAATDASEADLAVLKWQEARLEPVLDNEGFETIDVDTADPDAVASTMSCLPQVR